MEIIQTNLRELRNIGFDSSEKVTSFRVVSYTQQWAFRHTFVQEFYCAPILRWLILINKSDSLRVIQDIPYHFKRMPGRVTPRFVRNRLFRINLI